MSVSFNFPADTPTSGLASFSRRLQQPRLTFAPLIPSTPPHPFQFLWASANFYIVLILICATLGVRIAGWKAWRRTAWPELRHIVQEVEAVSRGLIFRPAHGRFAGASADEPALRTYSEAADTARRTGMSVRAVLREVGTPETEVVAVLRKGMRAMEEAARAKGVVLPDAEDSPHGDSDGLLRGAVPAAETSL